MFHKSHRRGFTLIELLVVIAIIAILIGLLLPAIQKVREASARSQCQNNIKQLTLAMHTYHDARGKLPPRQATRDTGRSGRLSTWVFLLPYMDQSALDQWFDANRSTYNDPWDTSTAKGLPYITWIPTMTCPSDAPPFDYMASKPNNYMPCVGDSTNAFGTDGNGGPVAGLRGAFGLNSGVKMGHITDGTSNTIAVGERMRGIAARYRGLNAQIWNVGTSTTPTQCQAKFDPSTAQYITSGSFTGNDYQTPGREWADGATTYNALTTNIPPNGASCSYAGEGTGGVLSFSSYHAGGVNVAFFDGSIRFIADSVESGDQTVRADNISSGASPFGVWGAMGTKDADDYVSQ